jgi:glycosyltransferase involved in cell wall biosynthesis
MTRIVFFSAAHPALDKRVFDKEARSLAAAGFEVTHVCPAEPNAPGDAYERDGVALRTVRRVRGRLWRPLTLFASLKVAAAQRPQVLHCNEVDSWFLAVMAAPFLGARVVFDAHEDYHGMVGERLPGQLKPIGSALFRLLTEVATRLTWRVVLAKDSIAGDYGSARGKLVVAKNYGPVPPFDPQKKPGTPPLRLVHLGLIGRKRGWPQLLSAVRDLSDVDIHLTVVGEFNDDSEGDFRAALDDPSLRDRVALIPWLPYDDAFKLLVDAHVGLVLFQPGYRNHVRALPHKMFDYMAAGCAVIAPAFATEVADIMRQSGAGPLVDPSDPAEIAQAIRTLLDKDVREGYATAGRRAVEEVFNWRQEARKLTAMYEALRPTSDLPLSVEAAV